MKQSTIALGILAGIGFTAIVSVVALTACVVKSSSRLRWVIFTTI